MTLFSERLANLRNKLNITQKKISCDLGLSERNYQRLESNPNNPKIDTLIKIADYFDVSIDYLTGRTDNPQINK